MDFAEKNARLRALSLLCGVLFACSGCAKAPKPRGPAVRTARWTAIVDWQSAGVEAASVLSAYLQIDTRNPPGNETKGARYLAALLRREGIPSEIFEFAPGRGSLVARLAGSGGSRQRPLCLLSHIDVATFEPSEWPRGRGPLSGTIDRDGVIWGRGALDMKGLGVAELMTFIWLKRLGVPLRRDVVLLAVADEEVGNSGIRHLIKRHRDKVNCGQVINEGGFGLRGVLFEDQTIYAISIAEKGILWLKMEVRGEGGHGSTPRPEHAPSRLLDALQRLRRRRPTPVLHPSFEVFFQQVGQAKGGVAGFFVGRPWLIKPLLLDKLMQNPGTRAALVDTINITGLSTGDHQPNVVPSRASATLDCRLLPGSTPEKVIAELRRLTGNDPRIRFEQLFYAPAMGSPWQDPLFDALARHSVAGQARAAAGPVLSIGFTDSLYLRQIGARAYGFAPFEITEDEAKTMHAAKERLSVANLRRGTRVLLSAVIEVVADHATKTPGGPRKIAPRFVPPQAPATSRPVGPASGPTSRPALRGAP